MSAAIRLTAVDTRFDSGVEALRGVGVEVPPGQFAALDEITRARLNDDLLALWQAQGFTVLFVTHSVFEAVYLSQRVLVMSGRPGRLVADLVVDEPYPRGAELRLSTRYAERCRAVSVALESGYGADLSP